MPERSRRLRASGAGANIGSITMLIWLGSTPVLTARACRNTSMSCWCWIKNAVQLVMVSFPLSKAEALMTNVVLMIA